jgi:hypothetical protein
MQTIKLDKQTFSVTSLTDETDEKIYWLNKSPAQRLEALELMRTIVYGYDPLTTRLQRILTITEFTPN